MDKFHHYTTIDTLALILKSKKLRFRRLDLVDDISETEKTRYNVSSHYYVSCWTKEEKESIPLWKDRDSNMRGVRISTDFNPIKTEVILSKNGSDDSFETPILNSCNIRVDEELRKRYFYWHPNKDDKTMRFYKMSYIDDENDFSRLKMNCVSEKETIQDVLVLLKSGYWRYQNEYRLIVPLLPYATKYPLVGKEFTEEIQKVKCHFEYYDFDLKEEFVNNIEITLGPLCSESDKTIVESLLKNFTTKGCSSESELFGKIRSK